MSNDGEETCAAIPVPAEWSAQLAGYAWARDKVGESSSAVYRLHGKAGAPDLFLKHGRGTAARDIMREAARLRWLAAHLAAPAVLDFALAPGEAWLLMTALPGVTAYQALEAQPGDRLAIIDALADFLRRFHAISASACPFNSDQHIRLAQARQRIDAGLVEEDDFDPERKGWTGEQVWQAMQTLLPLAPDPVVTHGDFSLDNLLMVDGQVVGCIDAGRVGIADRYQDLAILWNCLGEFGGESQARLFEQYGIADPNGAKLQFHLMLDELF